MDLHSICVYCGSSPGGSPEYLRAAGALGREVGRRGLKLVYGGAGVGLMGEVARSAMAAGAKVIGVIPQALAEQEIASTDRIELRVVRDMHERKAVMAELADGFIALPGGFGTFEEFFEALTWLQLGLHTKPCGLLNVNGYFDLLLGFLDHAVKEMFVYRPHRELIMASSDAANLIDQFCQYQPVRINKAEWVRRMAGNK